MAAERRAGFTLIELLIAMLISGMLVTVIFQMMQGQGRFVAVQGGREEVQQNARAAVELIGSELRSVPPADGLWAAGATEFALRVPRAWGVVCSVGSGQIDVAIPTNVAFSTTINDSLALVVNRGTPAAPDWAERVRVSGISGASATCNGIDLVNAERRTLSVSSVPTPLPLGSRAYLYDFVAYDVGASGGVDGRWIRRKDGGGSFQPFAGPVTAGTDGAPPGMELRYFMPGSNTPETLPMSDATRRAVNRVRLVVRAASQGRLDGTPQVEVDSVTLFLRNR